MSRYAAGLEFAVPTPLHAQTPAALDAVEAVRRHGQAKREEVAVTSLVTDHGQPAYEPYDGVVLVRNALALIKTAQALGWCVNVIEHADRCTVEGIRGEEGFRAHWERGRAKTGTWHESRIRYAMVDDTRPEGISKLTRVGLAGKRTAGLGRHHLEIVASPAGVSIGVAAVIARVKG